MGETDLDEYSLIYSYDLPPLRSMQEVAVNENFSIVIHLGLWEFLSSLSLFFYNNNIEEYELYNRYERFKKV